MRLPWRLCLRPVKHGSERVFPIWKYIEILAYKRFLLVTTKASFLVLWMQAHNGPTVFAQTSNNAKIIMQVASASITTLSSVHLTPPLSIRRAIGRPAMK